jgi:hypothetical protein
MKTNELLELLSPGITSSEDNFNKLKTVLKENGNLNLVLKDGNKINNIKSIAKWGTGLFYGFNLGQENFTKSVSLNDIEF